MADIIAFPARKITGTTHDSQATGRPAAILFFTGVRIERHAEETRPARSPAKRPALNPERSTPRRRRS